MKQNESTELIGSKELAVKYGGKESIKVESKGCETCKKCCSGGNK